MSTLFRTNFEASISKQRPVRFCQLPPRPKLVRFCQRTLRNRPAGSRHLPTGMRPVRPQSKFPILSRRVPQSLAGLPLPSAKVAVTEKKTLRMKTVSCFLHWLGLDPDCMRMLDDETKMLAHHVRKMGNKAVPIFQQAVNEDPELFVEARVQITAAMYMLGRAIV